MNVSYLLSIIELYLKKPHEKLNIEVIKYDEYVKFNFFYDSSPLNKTYISVDLNTFWSFVKNIFSSIQNKNTITEELVDDNKNYVVKFKNREVIFSWFNNIELEKIRNNFNTNNKEFIFNKIENEKEIKEFERYEDKLLNNKNPKLSFSMGFTSFMTIFLSAIWFLDIFMIALWIFKALK